jgi:hypothetical protein
VDDFLAAIREFRTRTISMNWYLETYKKTGTKAERWWLENDFSKVVGHVSSARKDADHILRVLAPADATRAQLQKIQDMGARQL